MNFDDLLGRLIPLFEQKMAFSMELANREMSLREKTEERKVDLEYRKLEAQITGDKDKLTWEKEKLTTAIKGDYDLQTLRNNGTLDVKRLEGLNERDKQKIVEEGLNRRADQTESGLNRRADQTDRTEKQKSYLTTLGTILGHAQEVSQTDAEGKTLTKKPTSEVGNAARSLMEQTGLARPAATPQARNVASEAEFAVGVLREHEKAGTPDSARNYLNALPADTRQAALALLNPGNAATPAAGLSPAVTPAPEARTPISAVQPPAVPPAMDASRSIVQPTVPSPAVLPEKSLTAAAGPLDSGGKTAFGGTPGGILGEAWKRGGMQAAKIVEQRKEEEEKNRALRRARGLTVGGSF